MFAGYFLERFYMVLGLFWVTLWSQNDAQKEKSRFVERLFYLRIIDVFRGCGLHVGCQKDRKTEQASDLDAKSVL